MASRQENVRLGSIPGAINLDGEGNEKFEKFWRDLAESKNKQTAQLVLGYVEAEIETKETDSNQIWNQTLQAVRRKSVDFESAKRRFDENITKINQEQISEIQEFRSRLATVTQSNSKTRDQMKSDMPFKTTYAASENYHLAARLLPTRKIGAYCDYFLIPIVQNQSTYI